MCKLASLFSALALAAALGLPPPTARVANAESASQNTAKSNDAANDTGHAKAEEQKRQQLEETYRPTGQQPEESGTAVFPEPGRPQSAQPK